MKGMMDEVKFEFRIYESSPETKTQVALAVLRSLLVKFALCDCFTLYLFTAASSLYTTSLANSSMALGYRGRIRSGFAGEPR